MSIHTSRTHVAFSTVSYIVHINFVLVHNLKLIRTLFNNILGRTGILPCPLFLGILAREFCILLSIKLGIGIVLGILLGNRHFTRHKTWQSAFVPGNLYKLLHVPDKASINFTHTQYRYRSLRKHHSYTIKSELT